MNTCCCLRESQEALATEKSAHDSTCAQFTQLQDDFEEQRQELEREREILRRITAVVSPGCGPGVALVAAVQKLKRDSEELTSLRSDLAARDATIAGLEEYRASLVARIDKAAELLARTLKWTPESKTAMRRAYEVLTSPQPESGEARGADPEREGLRGAISHYAAENDSMNNTVHRTVVAAHLREILAAHPAEKPTPPAQHMSADELAERDPADDATGDCEKCGQSLFSAHTGCAENPTPGAPTDAASFKAYIEQRAREFYPVTGEERELADLRARAEKALGLLQKQRTALTGERVIGAVSIGGTEEIIDALLGMNATPSDAPEPSAGDVPEKRYIPWANAGGPNECEHGYAAGIPCPFCDMEKGVAAPSDAPEQAEKGGECHKPFPCGDGTCRALRWRRLTQFCATSWR